MDAIAQAIGITAAQLNQLLVLAVVLVVGLVVLRVVLKLTATLFRVGCFGIVLIVAAVYIIRILNS